MDNTTQNVTPSPRIEHHTQPLEPADRKLRPRRERMLRVRIDCAVLAQTIPGGACLARGLNECLVFESDLPIIEAMVEQDPEAVEAARRTFIKRRDIAVAKELSDPDWADQTVEQLARERLRMIAEYAGSAEALFYAEHDRSMNPLRSVVVLERDILPPAEQDALTEQAKTSELLANSMGVAIATAIEKALDRRDRAPAPIADASEKKAGAR